MNFPHMIPYANPTYFGYVFLLILPIVFGLLKFQRRFLTYEALITLFFLFVSFGGSDYKQGLALIGYVAFQTILVWGYFKIRQKNNSTPLFYIAVILAILPLTLSKLTPFFEQGKASMFGFLGISYLTFKSVQMVMEIRDGMIKECHPVSYVRFLLFFPTISSGPIDRYRRFEKDVKASLSGEQYLEMVAQGVTRIFIGFLYKFIIGYYLGSLLLPLVQRLALNYHGISLPLVGVMYVYSLYLFFDFAGYSLFAVGVSNLMGYDTPMNFNKPFLSWNIKEFWNRWHMSLSFWFRDYVYMRLMFTLMKKKVFKSRIVASNIGYFALFLLMGVWHGLTWYYIVYGLYHATLICLTDSYLRFKKKHKDRLPSNKFTHVLAVVATFHAVAFSFLIFSGFLDQLFFK